MGPTRQDTQRVTLQIRDPESGNLINFGVFDKKSGGAVDTDIYKYKPGGMAEQVSLGGSPTIEDLTISRLHRHERDHAALQRYFNWAGRAKCTVSQFVLDVDGNVFGNPIVWVGVLKTVTPPDHDSESTDPAMLELVVSPDGKPTA
jgi:hypothetical protein